MEEIGFRAWDAVEGKMVVVTHLSWEHPSGLEVNRSNIVGFVESLMQYIGFKDKNGDKIYEADILRDDGNRRLLVEQDRGGFRFKALTKTNFIYAPSYQWFESFIQSPRPEIIGNVFENPELCQASKQKRRSKPDGVTRMSE